MEAKHEYLFQQNIQKKERKKSSGICRNRYVIEVLGQVEGAPEPISGLSSRVRPQRVQDDGGGSVSIGFGL
jgi:hypothetical protein